MIHRRYIASVAEEIKEIQKEVANGHKAVILGHNNECYSNMIYYDCEHCDTHLSIKANKEPLHRGLAICPECDKKRMINSVYLYEN